MDSDYPIGLNSSGSRDSIKTNKFRGKRRIIDVQDKIWEEQTNITTSNKYKHLLPRVRQLL